MRALKNRYGGVPIATALMILVFAVVISVGIFLSYVQIQTMAVRNAMNKGLSNLAVTISSDTYTALRESDFDAYVRKLTSASSYRNRLTETYISDVSSVIPLSTDRYRINGIRLDFTAEGKKLTYTCTCGVEFHVTVLGMDAAAAVREVTVSGSHTAKYGR